jgi:Protein of unknown function (DUF3365)
LQVRFWEQHSHRRWRRAGIGLSAGIALSGVLAFAVFADPPSPSAAGDENARIGQSLAVMLSSVRTVISKNQDLINDQNIGDKGLNAAKVVAEASAVYQATSGVAPSAIDPNSRQGKLMRMQLDAVAEVIEAHQQTINRQGVGFKGFIPAVVARLVNEAFERRAGSIAAMKVTAPPELVRNPKVVPDAWEREIISTQLMSPTWPKGQSYAANVEKGGVKAERILIPEYYGRSCLTCHGSPRGEIDITGFPKEGAKEGDLGGIISITLYR